MREYNKLIILVMGLVSTLAWLVYIFCDDERWFSRMCLSLGLLSVYTIIQTLEERK